MPHQNCSPRADNKHYSRCREQIPPVNASPSIYQTEKHRNMKLISFYKGLRYKEVMDLNQKFLALVIPKSWKYTVLMEAHDKLGHQVATHTYCLIKCQYCWKGMNKDIRKYIALIIDHLTGWPEAFPIPDKSADTIVSTFINHYLPADMCPRCMLSDNGTELKNQLMDQAFQQLGIDHIFSAPYHPQSKGKLEVFHKYLKPTFKKL